MMKQSHFTFLFLITGILFFMGLPQALAQNCSDNFLKVFDPEFFPYKVIQKTDSHIHLDGEARFDDKTLLAQTLKTLLTKYVPNPTCHMRASVKVQKDEALFFRFILRESDIRLHQSKIISWPEFVRRLQITEEATLAEIKNQVKKFKQQNQMAEAKLWLLKWIEKEAQSSIPFVLMANLEMEAKNFSEAVNYFQKALLINPQDEVALYNLAHSYSALGQFNESTALFQKIVADFETRKFEWVTLEDAKLRWLSDLIRDQKIDEAKTVAQTLVSQSLEFELLKIEILRHEKNHQEAIQNTKNLLDKFESHKPLLLYNLIVLELDFKDKPMADVYYKELQAIDPALAKDFSFLDSWQDLEEGVIDVP